MKKGDAMLKKITIVLLFVTIVCSIAYSQNPDLCWTHKCTNGSGDISTAEVVTNEGCHQAHEGVVFCSAWNGEQQSIKDCTIQWPDPWYHRWFFSRSLCD